MRTWTATLGAAALVAVAAPAAAVTVQATYVGTVTQGYDTTGLFGTPLATLDGLGFTLSYVYDTAVGVLDTPSAGQQTLFGGTTYGTPSPMQARITIGGVTFAWQAGYLGFVNQCSAAICGGSGFVVHQAYEDRTDPATGIETVSYATSYGALQYGTGSTGTIPGELDTPYVLTYGDSLPGYSDLFEHYVFDPATGTTSAAFAFLAPTRLTVGPPGDPSPVPLPATGWLLMAGLAMMGIRRGRG